MTVEGVDYSWARPDPACMHSKGRRFACRYLSFNTDAKTISRGEADQLADAGLWIVANWEQTGTGDIGGHTVAEAVERALQIADQCAIPTGRPIYASVDYDVQPDEYNRFEDLIGQACDLLGGAYDGAAMYGSHDIIKAMFDRGAIRWGWQTYAWSGGLWEPRAQLQQYQNGVNLCGGEVDYDRATTADYGQWQPGTLPAGADTGGSDDMGTFKTTVCHETQALSNKWRTLAMDDDGNQSWVWGPCKFQAHANVTIQGLPPGGASARFRWVSVDVRDSDGYTKPDPVNQWPDIEVSGTSGGTYQEVTQYGQIGDPPSGYSRRLRLQGYSDAASGVALSYLRCNLFSQ